jgi:hypothetical protein
MGVSVEDLERAEGRYRLEMELVDEARLTRNRLVREAVASGWTYREVAAATGLSRARVGQLVSPRQ